jgi:membrane protease YdiL (CAAX protease family)
VGITLVLLSLIGPIMSLFPDSVEELKTMDRQLRSLPRGLTWVLVVVLAPIGEEIFFRAALLRGIRSTLGTTAGLLLSSGFFAFFHGLAPRMLVTFLVGLWLGGLYLTGRGLALCVTAHMLNNGVVLALMFGGVEDIPLWWGAVGVAFFLAAAVGLRFSRQGSPPPGTS